MKESFDVEKEFPNVQAWIGRMLEREAVKKIWQMRSAA